MKTITITALVLSTLFLAPSAGAINPFQSNPSGQINYNKQLVVYKNSTAASSSVSIQINKNSRTQANNSICDKKKPPTCFFEFGKNQNPKLTKQQIRFIKKGRIFQIVIKPDNVIMPRAGATVDNQVYVFNCSTYSNKKGYFSCKKKRASV